MTAHEYPPEGVVPYDVDWPDRYAELSDAIRAHLGSAWEVEHIGSTSVPGLPAKPVIDIAVRLPGETFLERDRAAFQGLGWTDPVDLGTHNALFRLDGSVRRAIAHLFTPAEWPLAHQRLFAAWLRANPGDRDAYARLKRSLRDGGVWGHDYTAAKTAFIQDVIDRARAARGLVSVSVWDTEN